MDIFDGISDFVEGNVIDLSQATWVDFAQDFVADVANGVGDTVLNSASQLVGFNALISQYAPPKLVNSAGGRIDPNTAVLDGDVVVLIHGWQSSYQTFSNLYNTLEEKYPDKQVLGLDWSELADLPGDLLDIDWPGDFLDFANFQARPDNTVRAIAYVAEIIADQLQTRLGVTGQELTVIGHSLGALVASELGRLYTATNEPLDQLIALDPAAFAKNYDIDGRDDEELNSSFFSFPGLATSTPDTKQTVQDFNLVAQNSLSLVVKDENFISGLAGDNDFAATAHDSFLVDFPFSFNPAEPHNAVIPVFETALRENYFTLEKAEFGLPQRLDDQYTNAGKINAAQGSKTPGHEGIITAEFDGTITQYLPAPAFDALQLVNDGGVGVVADGEDSDAGITAEVPPPVPTVDASPPLSPLDELLDLTGFDGEVTVNVTLEREAAFDNLLRFYQTDGLGTIAGILPGAAGYEDAVRQNLLASPTLSVADGATVEQAIALTGGTYYAPALLVQGNLADLVTIDDAALGSDRVQRDGNVWKFEDATDFDFNDLVLTIVEVGSGT